MEDEQKEKTNIESNNENIKSKNKNSKEEKPDDQDLIDEIVKIDNSNLKAKLLCLNELNTNLIDTKQINYKPEYVDLRNKYELKYFDVYQKIIDIAVGNKSPDELISFTKEELEKYNINEESDDLKDVMNIAHTFNKLSMNDKIEALEEINLINYQRCKQNVAVR